jgi:hypothetical protein
VESLTSCAVPEQLRVEGLALDDYGITICASTNTPTAGCPVCGRTSRRIHGYYGRTPADLPLGGVPVRLRVRVRKLFCDDPTCGRRIFAERLEEVSRPLARGTERRGEALEHRAAAAIAEGPDRQAATRPSQGARRYLVGGQDRLLVAGDARGVRRLHDRLQAMEGLERAGIVAAYPPGARMGRVARTGDQTPQVML